MPGCLNNSIENIEATARFLTGLARMRQGCSSAETGVENGRSPQAVSNYSQFTAEVLDECYQHLAGQPLKQPHAIMNGSW